MIHEFLWQTRFQQQKTINNVVCTPHLLHKKCYIKTYDILCVILHAKCVIYEE